MPFMPASLPLNPFRNDEPAASEAEPPAWLIIELKSLAIVFWLPSIEGIIVRYAFPTSAISFSPFLFKPRPQLVTRKSALAVVVLIPAGVCPRSRVRLRLFRLFPHAQRHEVGVDLREHVVNVSQYAVCLDPLPPDADVTVDVSGKRRVFFLKC